MIIFPSEVSLLKSLEWNVFLRVFVQRRLDLSQFKKRAKQPPKILFQMTWLKKRITKPFVLIFFWKIKGRSKPRNLLTIKHIV